MTDAAGRVGILLPALPDTLGLVVDGDSLALETRFWKPPYRLKFERGRDLNQLNPGKVRRYRKTNRAYYRIVDWIIGTLIATVNEDTHVLVVSDHGFAMEHHPNYFHHKTAPPGLLMMLGPGISAGTSIDDAHILDIFPTLLYCLGLPLATDVEGRVLADVFSTEFQQANITSTIGSYSSLRPSLQKNGTTTEDDRRSSKTMMKRLRALGYIQ
jgi:arylsulfatase A-like enzyme